MITDAYLDATRASTALPADQSRMRPAPIARRHFPWIGLGVALLGIGLLGFNLWWYWRDTRPVADMATISGWMAREQYTLAETALRERLRRSPHDGDVHTTLAKVLAARGDLPGCIAQLRLVPPWWPTKPEALYREGQVHLMMDRAKDAEACWLAVAGDDPLHPSPADVAHDAGNELIKLYAVEDRWDDLRVILWQAYEKANPADYMALLYMRVRSELERVAPDETINKLERYVAADPADWEALRALAKAASALGRPAEAALHFQACLKGRPDDARAWSDYLNMLHAQGDMDAWSALLDQVPPSADGEAEIWKFRGLRKERAGDWAGAASDYRAALERDPYITAYHYRLAMVEERLGHRDVAAEHRKQADQLRAARGQLLTAFTEVIDAQEHKTTTAPDLPASMRRLASICETLGWARLADAWYKLAESS